MPDTPNEFHWRDGISFSREIVTTPPGAVTVRIRESAQRDAPVRGEFTIPPNEWASIVAFVSATGETSESYQGALHFHQFDPADAT